MIANGHGGCSTGGEATASRTAPASRRTAPIATAKRTPAGMAARARADSAGAIAAAAGAIVGSPDGTPAIADGPYARPFPEAGAGASGDSLMGCGIRPPVHLPDHWQ